MTPFFNKPKYSTIQAQPRKDIPTGLWQKCPGCGNVVHRSQIEENMGTCPECGHHHRITCYERLRMLVDPGSFKQMDGEMTSADPLGFVDMKPYAAKLERDRGKTGMSSAIICGDATIEGQGLALGIMDFRFRGGSMGSVVGEKVTRLIEHATAAGLPVVIFSASGGARMEEGMLSLMQMAKTSGALSRHKRAGLPYIAVLTHPTTGGVTASFASLGDVILAEPGALIGFAGMRVIQQTIKADLPPGFQTAEFLLEKGLVDRIVPRQELRGELALLLAYMTPAPAEA